MEFVTLHVNFPKIFYVNNSYSVPFLMACSVYLYEDLKKIKAIFFISSLNTVALNKSQEILGVFYTLDLTYFPSVVAETHLFSSYLSDKHSFDRD